MLINSVSESKCTFGGSTFETGEKITYTFEADHVNKGGNKGTCQNGQIIPDSTVSHSSAIGMFLVDRLVG